MVADSELSNSFESMLESIDVPETPIARIHERMHAGVPPQRTRFAIPAAVAAAIAIVIAVPMLAPAVTQTLEQKIAAILHWSPPPVKPPPSLYQAMKPQTVSLEEAQKRVNFTIVPPQGVPSDATGPSITVGPTGFYSRTTRTWSSGPAVVMFSYKRSDGRTFLVSASGASDESAWVGPPSKYMFEDRGVDKAGNPILVRHERFVWKNGDQRMTIIADEGITAAEILAIQSAMHGIPIPGVWPPKHGADVMMRVPKPQ
jgi:hypothetical protein